MNKYQQALNRLICNISVTRSDYRRSGKASEDIDILQVLVDKATPKKPDLEGDGYWDGELVYDTWICPCCEEHYEVDYDKYDYCPNCGQAIDWSEENDQ